MQGIEVFPRKPLILIVDDVPNNLQIIGTILGNAGYEIAFASDHIGAFDVLTFTKPDLILLDVMMPGMDGLELCEKIKSNPKTKEIPVIFLTARVNTDDIVAGFQAGAVDYIHKPFNIKELLVRIKTHLQLKFAGELIQQHNEEIKRVNDMLYGLNHEKDKYLAIIHQELQSAAEYVHSLLPKSIKEGQIKADWVYVPSSSLGGDSFGYKYLDAENFAFYLLDVCGHGIKSALHSVSILNVLNFGNLPDTDFRKPEQVLAELNNRFQMSVHNDLFFSMFYAVFNIRTRKLTYSGAGHPPVFMLDSKHKETALPSRNKIMGIIPQLQFTSDTISIKPNTDLYLYTDGVYEFKTVSGKRGEVEDVLESIRNLNKSDDKKLQNIYLDSVYRNTEQSLKDDFSVLKIQLRTK